MSLDSASAAAALGVGVPASHGRRGRRSWYVHGPRHADRMHFGDRWGTRDGLPGPRVGGQATVRAPLASRSFPVCHYPISSSAWGWGVAATQTCLCGRLSSFQPPKRRPLFSPPLAGRRPPHTFWIPKPLEPQFVALVGNSDERKTRPRQKRDGDAVLPAAFGRAILDPARRECPSSPLCHGPGDSCPAAALLGCRSVSFRRPGRVASVPRLGTEGQRGSEGPRRRAPKARASAPDSGSQFLDGFVSLFWLQFNRVQASHASPPRE